MSTPQTTKHLSGKEVFFAALDIASLEDRAALLVRACAGDARKRRRIEQLLANHFQQDTFMEVPAVEDSPDVLCVSAEQSRSQHFLRRILSVEEVRFIPERLLFRVEGSRSFLNYFSVSVPPRENVSLPS